MKLRFLILLMVLAILPQPAVSQQAATPMSKDQIMSVVTAGIDNAELAKKIEERGIDFELEENYLQALRKAGAQEVVIQALRTVKPSPMSRDQLLLLVSGGVPSERAAALVKQRGIDFMPDGKLLESLRTAGADDALIAVVREAKPPEVQRHLARAAECEQKHRWAEAEKEYRAALALAPGNAEILQKAEAAAKHQKPPQFKLVKTILATDARLWCASAGEISPDGRWLAWSDCESMYMWNAATGDKGPSLRGKSPFAFSPDGRWLAAIAKDFKGVGVWEIATGREVGRLPAIADPWSPMQFSPDGRLLVLGEATDGTVRVWDLASGKEVLNVATHKDTDNGQARVRGVTFSPDGHLLAAEGAQKTIRLWDTATGKEVRTMAGPSKIWSAAAFSPDGHLLASGSYDTVMLWDVATGQVVHTLNLQDNFPVEVAFTPDGDWLATGGIRGLELWDVATGSTMIKLEGTSDTGHPAFSADGKWLVTSYNNYISLWQRQD